MELQTLHHSCLHSSAALLRKDDLRGLDQVVKHAAEVHHAESHCLVLQCGRIAPIYVKYNRGGKVYLHSICPQIQEPLHRTMSAQLHEALSHVFHHGDNRFKRILWHLQPSTLGQLTLG